MASMKVGFLFRLYGTKFYWFSTRPFRYVYRFLFSPKGRGVKVVILDGNTVLLARINYKHRLWTIPGGSVDKKESYEAAAHREILEELGIRINSLREVGEYVHKDMFQENATKVFTASPIDRNIVVDGIEIREATWFPLDALPSDRRLPNVDNVLRLAGFKV